MFKKWLSNLRKLLKNKTMLIAFSLLLILGFIFGYYFTDIMVTKNKANIQADESKDSIKTDLAKENSNNVNQEDASNEKTTSSTKLLFKTKYLKSQDEHKDILMADNELLGLDKNQLKKHYSEWEIISFSSEEIILEKNIDSYSPKHFKVGVAEKENDLFVAVFYYNKDGLEIIDYISNTPISILNKTEKEKFIEGMIFDNMEELHRMLENYDL